MPGVAELVARLERGTTVHDAVHACLDRIAEREPVVRAWAYLDPDAALESAGRLDASDAPRGGVFGVPLGVKDIFDTYDMPTEYGSPIYAGHRPAADAAVVALARRCGMLPLGKLVTTEFAAWPPGPTTNPHDPTRTPGGSSSGSAAAVAAGMVPAALATQTTGSIIRPAAFCGVVGLKPTLGLLPTTGVKAISESFDTVGVITRSALDAALVVGALSGRELTPTGDLPAPRLGVCLTHEWPAALPETVALFERLPDLLARAGSPAAMVELPAAFGGLAESQDVIWTYEIARCLADEHRRFRERIREPLRGMLDEGGAMPVARYDRAVAHLAECRAELGAALGDRDVLVVPAAPGEAPDIAATGDPVFNRIWSALGTPAVTIPAGRGPAGLPLGLQLVALPADDRRLLACAAWLERELGR